MKSNLFLAAALVVLAAPATAGWQYTTWGMAPSQVVTAGKGSVRLSPGTPGQILKGDPRTVQAEGTYASGDYAFDSAFYFRGGTKLAIVNLKLKNPTHGCGTLWADMKDAYGKPFEESKDRISGTAIWHDAAKNNRVVLFEIGAAYCSLEYQPLKDANNAGL